MTVKSLSPALWLFVALLLFSGLALVITYPLVLHLVDAVPVDIGDPLLNTWILAWDAHATLNDPLRLFDANVFFPLPDTLAYSEHLYSTAALILPLGLVSGQPVLAYNLSLLLSFPLAGLGMYLLVLSWTHRRAAALLAGLAFAFAPYRLTAIAHLQLLTIQWLPYSLLALDQVVRYQITNIKSQITNHKSQISNHKSQITNHKSQITGHGSRITRFWVLLVVFTTLQVLSSWYLAIFCGLILGVYTLGWCVAHLGRKHRAAVLPALGRLGLAALVVAGLTLPFAWPYLEVLPELQAARPASLAASFAARPGDFLVAPPYLRVFGPPTQPLAARPGFTEENTLFLGIVAPLLALAGLALGRPRWRVVTLGAILIVSLGLTFAAPYLALTRLLPALSVVRVPPRWVIPATFAIAALAGLGFAGLMGLARWGNGGMGEWGNGEMGGWGNGGMGDRGIGESGSRMRGDLGPGSPSPDSPLPDSPLPDSPLPDSPSPDSPIPDPLIPMLLVGLLLVVEAFAAPLPLAAVDSGHDLAPVYQVLRGAALSDAGRWAVVELPMHVAPAPEFPETKRMLASTLGWWGLVNGYSGFTPARQMALGESLAGFPDEAALGALEGLAGEGVRYLIVHPDEAPLDRATWESTGRWEAERGTSLLPVGRFGPDELYRINPYGDDLIADPMAVTDAYWSAHGPEAINVRFTPPDSETEIWLLAYAYQPDDWNIGSRAGLQPSNLPVFGSSNLPPQPRLSLFWRTSAPLDADYTVFVHSLTAQGALLGQADGPPLANHYPTSAWRPGEIVQDSRLAPAGDHYLVGLYDPVSGQRLAAFAPDGTRLPDGAATLAVD